MKRARTIVFLFAIVAGVSGAWAPLQAADPARPSYMRALERERALRDVANTPTLRQLRAVVAAYEQVARRYPASAYSDNALWQGGNLAALAYQRFGQADDKATAVRLLEALKKEHPSSSLVARVDDVIADLATELGPGPNIPKGPVPNPDIGHLPADSAKPPVPEAPKGPVPNSVVTIRDIKRTPLADGVRVTVQMDGESIYRQERVDNPDRVFFDLRGTRPVPALQDATLRFRDEDVVREIRLGRHPQNTTRIVMELRGVESYSVFTLYDPFRLIIDFRRAGAPTVPALLLGGPIAASLHPVVPPPPSLIATVTAAAPALPASTTVPAPGPIAIDSKTGEAPEPSPAPAKAPLVSREPLASVRTPPAVPTANSNGQFSLARQLGLGVSRIVIDAGHGGHDPGAQSNGITESELVLDVAQRLEKLLQKQAGVEVVMTRDSDVFIPLEERTAIANREAADLFLSIHANASRNPRARGVETYFLNFSTNPEAEAVAARENSASGRTMHSLPDILKAIALNTKIDESRDFATVVQRSMVNRLSQRNKELRDLGVKQAPFVVLIGAGMPSVLAEISFVTNRQEGLLLKTGAYRQRIADALLDAILRYQQSLKKIPAVATTREQR
jgi:N-acetylmuramoyl-L-alanine amidase